MKLETLGTVNVLWFLISIFLAFWLGEQLWMAISTKEILNLRVTNMVSFSGRPVWFVFVCAIKSVAWLLSILVIFFYIKRRLESRP